MLRRPHSSQAGIDGSTHEKAGYLARNGGNVSGPHGDLPWPCPAEGLGTGRPSCELVLHLVISDEHPLSGSVGPVGSDSPVAFRGWIDLMSAITALCANRPDADQQT